MMTPADYVGVAAMLTVPLTIVCLYLRGIRMDNDRFQKAISERIGAFDEKFDRHDGRLRELEENKVSHTNWVRVVASQQNRQNETREMVRELLGKVDATIGLTRQVTRIAEAVEAKMEH